MDGSVDSEAGAGGKSKPWVQQKTAATQLAAPGFSIAEWTHFDLEKYFLKWGRRQDPQSHSDRAGRMVEKDEGHSL